MSGGSDGRIRLWHEEPLHDSFAIHLKDHPAATTFSPCGRWLAIEESPADEPGRVTMLDLRTGRALWSLQCAIMSKAQNPLLNSHVEVFCL